MKLPPTLGKLDLSTVPKFIRERIEYNSPIPEVHDPEYAKRLIALYYSNLAQTDDCVGKVLDALKELGLEDDTIVLYTSDHGGMLGVHGLWQKSVFYEPSVGVPLLFRVPGATPANSRCETPVSLVQILPTLTELCGIPTPSGIDGTSFAANLREPGRDRRHNGFCGTRPCEPGTRLHDPEIISTAIIRTTCRSFLTFAGTRRK